MTLGILITAAFVTATMYILVKGSTDARLAIGIIILGVIATFIIYVSGSHKWLPLNQSVMIVDMLALVLFATLAHTSKKLWLLFLVAWQLATVVIHIASYFAQHLVPRAYGDAQSVWAYLQFAVIFWVTISERRILKKQMLL